MESLDLSIKHLLPIDRRKAAIIAQAASRFESTVTFEREGVILNAKSMLGMLSQSMPKDGAVTLIAEGEDEAQAVKELKRVIEELQVGV